MNDDEIRIGPRARELLDAYDSKTAMAEALAAVELQVEKLSKWVVDAGPVLDDAASALLGIDARLRALEPCPGASRGMGPPPPHLWRYDGSCELCPARRAR